jgi:hypothetical protein
LNGRSFVQRQRRTSAGLAGRLNTAVLSLGLLLVGGCLSGLRPALPHSEVSGLLFSPASADFYWQRSVMVLNRNHFQVARESRLEGVIETQYRAGSGVLEPWHPDSVGLASRVESSLQSIRRKVTIGVQPGDNGKTLLTVRVDKEQEDVPGLAANYEGGATFPESTVMSRDLSQVVGQSGTSRWVSVGRDRALEQRLISEIRYRQLP